MFFIYVFFFYLIIQNNVFPVENFPPNSSRSGIERYLSWHSACEHWQGYKLCEATLLLIAKCFVLDSWLLSLPFKLNSAFSIALQCRKAQLDYVSGRKFKMRENLQIYSFLSPRQFSFSGKALFRQVTLAKACLSEYRWFCITPNKSKFMEAFKFTRGRLKRKCARKLLL